MDGEILKKILKDDSEKLIIMDSGKPKFVVMSYDQYRRMTKNELVSVNEKFETDFNDLIARSDKSLGREDMIMGISKDLGDDKKNEQAEKLSLDDLPII